MLHLSRKLGQSIVIGNGRVKITVAEINKSNVKLSIECDQDLQVLREELWIKIKQSNLRSLDNLESVFNKKTD